MIRPAKANNILNQLERFGIRLGLEPTRRLLHALGGPHQDLVTVLVAGTNGKGSTAALLASMLTAAGYRTGLYTSPHLEEVEERLRIDGKAICSGRLGDLLEQAVGCGESLLGALPTYFEALTVAALSYFSQETVDIAVLEVGMGGRLDATNVVDPTLSLITPISFDHQRHLGSSLGAIAREKAGILRPEVPALAWVEEPEAWRALVEAAGGLGAGLVAAQERVELEDVRLRGWQETAVRLRTPIEHHSLTISLPGDHQAKNLGLAVLAAETLRTRGFHRLDAASIRNGAGRCRWPGRLEAVELSDGRRVLLDAAHNCGGAATLLAFLAPIQETYDLLFGAMLDKDVADILPPIAARAERVTLTMPPSPRGCLPSNLATLLRGRRVTLEPSVDRALDKALDSSGRTLVVCGSIYVVGEVRRALRRRFGVPGSSLFSSIPPSPHNNGS